MTKQVTISNKLKPNFNNEYKENFVVENLFPIDYVLHK